MIITVTLNPCVDKTLIVDSLQPGRTLFVSEVTRVGAGKGINVSRTVRNLGGETLAVWFRGGRTGEQVADSLAGEGIPSRPVAVDGELRTATTIVEQDGGRSTRLFEPGPEVTREEARNLVLTVSRALGPSDLLVMSGSVPCAELDGLYAELTRLAAARGARSVLDSRDRPLLLGLVERPYLVKANQEEAALVLGRPVADFGDAFEAAEALLRMGVEIAVVSLGKAGAVLASGTERWSATSPTVPEVSAIGSGDAMVAAMCLGISNGWPLPELLRWGVAAGAANAAVRDPGACRREKVEELLHEVSVVNESRIPQTFMPA